MVLAEQMLAQLGVTPAVVADAARLVRLTVAHDPATPRARSSATPTSSCSSGTVTAMRSA